jgi:hypothetical protein
MPGLEQGLEIGEDGRPSGRDRVHGVVVGEVRVSDSEPDDLVKGLNLEGHRGGTAGRGGSRGVERQGQPARWHRLQHCPDHVSDA